MPLPFVPIDQATITSLNGGDERALERIFREHFDVLLERATERLKGEPAAAPRLVAATVRELWEEREGFHTTAEIEGFVNEELRHRARSVRARMAAVHRFEKNEGVTTPAGHAPPTAEQVWKEVQTSMHTTSADRETRRKAQREHAAHGAAEHIAHVADRRSWRTPAILIAVGAVGLFGGYVWASRASERSVIMQLLAEADTSAVTTRAGQLGALDLPDGSKVRLGAESRLVVVPHFGRDYRTASASGAIAITVAEGGSRPLELRAGDLRVTATTGVLAVRDYGDEALRFVRSAGAGATLVTSSGERPLEVGATLAIDRNGAVREATVDEVTSAFGWLDGRLVLRDATVAGAVQELWRWYGVDIAVQDSAVLGRKLSIAVPLESSQAAIAALERGAQLTFAYVANKMTFRDAAPAAKRR